MIKPCAPWVRRGAPVAACVVALGVVTWGTRSRSFGTSRPLPANAQEQSAPAGAKGGGDELFAPSVAKVNMGTVSAGTVVHRRVEFRNVSHRPLRVTGVGSSCSCTRVETDKEEVAPDDILGVDVAYLASFDLRGTYTDTRTAAIYVEDRTEPAAQVVVTAKVKCTALPERDRVDFGTVRAGRRHVQSLQVYLDSHAPAPNVRYTLSGGSRSWLTLRVQRPIVAAPAAVAVAAPTGAFSGQASAPTRDASAEEQRRLIQVVEVELTRDAPVGTLNAELIMKPPNEPAIKIPISGEVVGTYQADPPTLFLGEVKEPGKVQAVVHLHDSKGRPPARIASVRSTSAYLKAAAGPSGVVVVRMTPSVPAGELRGTVIVTPARGEPSLRIPVYAQVIRQ